MEMEAKTLMNLGLQVSPFNSFNRILEKRFKTQLSGADGSYFFASVVAGAYLLKEIDPDGYNSTTSNEEAISFSEGGIVTVHFGDRIEGTIAGVVFDDLNGDENQDSNEQGISGVTIQLFSAQTKEQLEETTSASDGSYSFQEQPRAAYILVETDPTDFTSTTPNTVNISMIDGGTVTVNFG